MQYETIILELMNRIQVLENEVAQLKEERNSCARENPSRTYQKIDDAMIESCYSAGRDTLLGAKVSELAEQVKNRTGMNKHSALQYIYSVNALLTGKLYPRMISSGALTTCVFNIGKDYGPQGIEHALKSLDQLKEYRLQKGLKDLYLDGFISELRTRYNEGQFGEYRFHQELEK